MEPADELIERSVSALMSFRARRTAVGAGGSDRVKERNAEVKMHTKPAAIAGIPEVSDREFARFQSLIYRETGIYLSPVKRTLLAGRLCKRLRTLNLGCFREYYELVENDLAEKEQMINCICTNETHFFREKQHFEFLENRVFPGWKALGK